MRKKEIYIMKKDSGITLLSLIIVIIVMIILAFITINLAIGEQSIFEYGKQARIEHEISKYIEEVEISRADVALENLGRVTLDNLIKRIEEKNIFSGGKITKINEEKAEAITKEGYVIIITAKETRYDRTEKVEDASKLKVGDYVKYNVEKQSYTLSTSETGYESDQVFNTSNYTGLWRVLYNDSKHGLQIISAESVIDLNMKGKEGYNKLVTTLNTISSKYVNDVYAIRGRSVGSNPSLPEGTNSIYSNIEYSFIESMANDMIIADEDYSTDYNAMLLAGMTNIGKEYWMASRHIYIDANGAGFLGTQVNATGDIESYCLKCVHAIKTEKEHEYNRAVRPVITLKSNVLVTSGNGSSATPYELGI